MIASASPVYADSAMLVDAAFGVYPGVAAAELPMADTPLDHWHRALVLGGQGWYAAARVELGMLRTCSSDPVLLSLAASTEGSFLRQLGWHARASAADGRAAVLILPAGELGTRDQDVPGWYEAIGDALTGLAADALGTGRLALAQRLLRRSHEALETRSGDHWRPLVRWHWVAAETALAAGLAEAALPHAEAALAAAERGPSLRHRIKSRLLVAAAATVSDLDRAIALADSVGADCREHGLLPLRWASAMLRSGLATGGIAADAAAEASICAQHITRRGGQFRSVGVL